MKLFWTRTDSLMLIDYSMRKFKKKPYWFIFRILIKILDFFIEGHYCDSQNVADNIKKFGTKKPIKVFPDKINYTVKFEKIPHEGFNVIYYNPKSRTDKTFSDWLYGQDIILEIKKMLPHINFIELDGTKDMTKIYPIADYLLRPNRNDGASRMRQECEIQNIPYYWTNKNPSLNNAIKNIQNEFNTKQRAEL